MFCNLSIKKVRGWMHYSSAPILVAAICTNLPICCRSIISHLNIPFTILEPSLNTLLFEHFRKKDRTRRCVWYIRMLYYICLFTNGNNKDILPLIKACTDLFSYPFLYFHPFLHFHLPMLTTVFFLRQASFLWRKFPRIVPDFSRRVFP